MERVALVLQPVGVCKEAERDRPGYTWNLLIEFAMFFSEIPTFTYDQRHERRSQVLAKLHNHRGKTLGVGSAFVGLDIGFALMP